MKTSPHLTQKTVLHALQPDVPVLIAGPTASGKSALAMRIAEEQGGVIINADASQVYDCWRVVSARPSAEEEAATPHALYGHVSASAAYSVGHWLREITPLLQSGPRPIIVGGTGLYFAALTQGLADIPSIPEDVRAKADALSLEVMRDALDAPTRGQIDTLNRMRVQRAWEVLTATGRSLAEWQSDIAEPLLPVEKVYPVVFDAPKEWLNDRIERRFDLMIEQGALEEARALLPNYNPNLPAHRAIGGPELIAHLRGQLSLEQAKEAAVIATRQFAKRQRTWFRSKMKQWHPYHNLG